METKFIFVCAFAIFFGFFQIVAVLDNNNLMSYQNLISNLDFVNGTQQPQWYLINVLPRDLAAGYFIPGSINIPVHLLQTQLKRWPRARKIIIYCAGRNCPLSKYAFQELKSMGFQDVWMLDKVWPAALP